MKRKLFEKICRSILIALVVGCTLQFGYIASGWAFESSGLFSEDYTPMQYAASNSLATSTHAVTGIGVSYLIYSASSTFSYHLAFTTSTFISTSTRLSTPNIVVSSEAVVPAGFILSDTFKIEVVNPKLVISGLSPAATVYVWIDYGQAKTSWGGN